MENRSWEGGTQWRTPTILVDQEMNGVYSGDILGEEEEKKTWQIYKKKRRRTGGERRGERKKEEGREERRAREETIIWRKKIEGRRKKSAANKKLHAAAKGISISNAGVTKARTAHLPLAARGESTRWQDAMAVASGREAHTNGVRASTKNCGMRKQRASQTISMLRGRMSAKQKTLERLKAKKKTAAHRCPMPF